MVNVFFDGVDHFTIREYQGRSERHKGQWRIYSNGSEGWKAFHENGLTNVWTSREQAEMQLSYIADVKGWKYVGEREE